MTLKKWQLGETVPVSEQFHPVWNAAIFQCIPEITKKYAREWDYI